MGKKDSKWLFEKQAMSKQFISIMGWRIPILDVPKDSNAVAYTTPEPAIYLSKDNDLTKSLPEHKARAVHFGLFAHEMAHQQFTNFEHLNDVCKGMDRKEAIMFNIIFDILEDPAMETLAGTLFGGYLLKSLKYMIKRSYEVSEPIQTKKTGLEQCFQAMAQFGWMGLPKGRFTDLKAKSVFYRIIPTFQDIINCGDPTARVDMSLTIFNEMEPLWRDFVDAMPDPSELEAALGSMLGSLGVGMESGSSSGEDVDPEDLADAADLSKGARRDTTIKRLSEMDEEEKAARGISDEEDLTPSKEEEDEEVLSSEDEEEEHANKESDDTAEIVFSESFMDLSTEKDYDPEEYEMDVEAMDFFERLIQTEIELSASEAKPKEEEIPDFPEIDKKYSMRHYKNRNVFINSSDPAKAEYAYNRIVKKNEKKISTCYSKLKRMFAEEAEETEYKSSGKLSIDRTVSTTVTSKLFTKSVDPKDKSNMAVMIAIDESGSMYGSRIERAKEAAINLAEIFGRLGISTYILGYTADTSGADVVHHHYTTWENKREDRWKLTSIAALANNFDGYSIRYASNILKLRPETHKLMIVISDGQPACNAYNYEAGYSDTKDAIREARGNDQVVLGVAIGSDEDVLQKMYGRDFIFLETGDDLFGGIMKKFTEMVKKW